MSFIDPTRDKTVSCQPRCIGVRTPSVIIDQYADISYIPSEELFYQLGLRQFGNLGQFKLDPPAPIDQLLSLAVEHEDGIGASGLDRQQVVDVGL